MDTPSAALSELCYVPVPFVLLIVRADNCPVCIELEAKGFFTSLSSIMCILETIRIDAVDSYLWPEYLNLIEGFPKIACMSPETFERLDDEASLREMEFFNWTYDKDIGIMMETGNRPITIGAVRDFCDGYVSRQEKSPEELDRPNRPKDRELPDVPLIDPKPMANDQKWGGSEAQWQGTEEAIARSLAAEPQAVKHHSHLSNIPHPKVWSIPLGRYLTDEEAVIHHPPTHTGEKFGSSEVVQSRQWYGTAEAIALSLQSDQKLVAPPSASSSLISKPIACLPKQTLAHFMERVNILVDLMIGIFKAYGSTTLIALERARNFKNLLASIRGVGNGNEVVQKRILELFRDMHTAYRTRILSSPDGRWLTQHSVVIIESNIKNRLLHISSAYIFGKDSAELLYRTLLAVFEKIAM